jgi:hypothetical protein
LHNLENKGDDLQDRQNAGVMVSLELWETQALGWWILSRPGFNYTRGVKLAGHLSRVSLKFGATKFPKTPVVSMGRRNTQLRPTFIENKS